MLIKKETIGTPVDVVLLKALREVGIRPLDRLSVQRYMRSMTRTWRNILLVWFGFPAVLVGLLGTFIVARSDPSMALRNWSHASWFWPALLGFGLAALLVEFRIVPRSYWGSRDLKSITQFNISAFPLLPRPVLEIALRVKEVLPEVEFHVHYLTHERGAWRAIVDPDPFLEAQFGSESYFIAVWDEPGFDGKLLHIE